VPQEEEVPCCTPLAFLFTVCSWKHTAACNACSALGKSLFLCSFAQASCLCLQHEKEMRRPGTSMQILNSCPFLLGSPHSLLLATSLPVPVAALPCHPPRHLHCCLSMQLLAKHAAMLITVRITLSADVRLLRPCRCCCKRLRAQKSHHAISRQASLCKLS
jgi:hypothetical protein